MPTFNVNTRNFLTSFEFEVQSFPEPTPTCLGFFKLPEFIVHAAGLLARTHKIAAIKLVREFYLRENEVSLGLLEAKLIVEKMVKDAEERERLQNL